VRSLIVAAAALLAVGTAVPALAAPAITTSTPAPTTLSSIQLHSAATSVLAKKKKKKKTSESATITEIGNATRGKIDLEIKATVAKSGRECKMSVKWKDGSNTDDETVSKDDKVCEFSIEVPNNTKVVGEATANLTVKDSGGKKVATASRKFTVK
jgi:hypothetical protein